MYAESRKLRLVEEVLSIKNEHILVEIEDFLKKVKKTKSAQKQSARDFVGVWNREDADLIEKAIEDGCEEINPDDWK